MVFKFIFSLAVTLILCKEVVHAKSAKRQDVEGESSPTDVYEDGSYDYDYGTAPRRFPFYRYQQKSNPTTTPHPFMSYWQNIMRNVRVPVPSITWNVTNPLANLFNMPEDHPIDESYVLSSQQRHKTKRRRKNSHKKRHRKNNHQNGNNPELEEQNEVAMQEEQMLLQQYQNPLGPNTPMYFYDPNTDAYYAVQRVRALGPYMEGTYYNPTITNSVGHSPRVKDQPDVPDDKETINSSEMENINSDEDDVENDIDLDETEEIDPDKQNLNEMPKKSKHENQDEKVQKPFINEETLRNVLGSYMLDDRYNRQRQRSKEQRQEKGTLRQKPRDNYRYYFLLNKN